MMYFRILDDVFHRFPDACIGLVVARGVHNDVPVPAITNILREAERAVYQRFAAHGIQDELALAVWRKAFSQLGISNGRYKTSVEALVSRVLKGSALPELNPAVDLANAVSLTHLLPVGAHDLDRVHGDLEVGPARAGALFTPLGHLEQESVDEGEFVYADAQEVRTRRWVWRQSDRSKVVAHTHNIVFPIDGWLGQTDVAVRAAQADLVRFLQTSLGAATQTFFLDRAHQEVVLPANADLPDNAVEVNGGFRMAGLGYLERPDPLPATPAMEHVAEPLPGAHDARHGSRHVAWASADTVDELLMRGVVDVVVREELEARLRRGEKLRVKFGVDPTSPQLHLGHAVVLRKLRAFQTQGHTICLVIGDFTAQIGDASDKTSMRQMLGEEQVYNNLATYRKQIAGILDEHAVEWSYNADWLGPLRFKDVVGLASNFTVAQILERENFTNRYAAGQPIGLQEFLYPLMQGYDSVALKADVELGGTEQLFNLLAGRTLQKAYGQRPQSVMTLALLLGLDGRKMSKSFGNAIALDEPAKDMYGKLMSIPDEQIMPSFELCTDVSPAELMVIATEIEGGAHPMALKKRLAYETTRLYHGAAQAQKAQQVFEREVQRKERPDDEEIPQVVLPHGGLWSPPDLLVALGLTPSKAEARRKIVEGAVHVDEAQLGDAHTELDVHNGMVVRLGKRNYRRVRLPS